MDTVTRERSRDGAVTGAARELESGAAATSDWLRPRSDTTHVDIAEARALALGRIVRDGRLMARRSHRIT